MPRSNKWVAALAAGGTTVGVVAALGYAPTVSGAPSSASAKPQRATEQVGSDRAQLVAAVAQVNQLQLRINDLRRQLLAEEKTPLPASTYVVPRVAVPSAFSASQSSAAPSGWQAQLRSEQRQLAAEQGRLVAEQAGLASERNALARGAAQLQAEQEQLVQEEHRLATASSPAPATHVTTGASGSTGATGGTGVSDGTGSDD
jgi:hypothetical protein